MDPKTRYRQLTEGEKDLMAEGRKLGDQLQAWLDRIDELRPERGEHKRWLAIGRTHLQQGLMAANRAVTNPDFF